MQDPMILNSSQGEVQNLTLEAQIFIFCQSDTEHAASAALMTLDHSISNSGLEAHLKRAVELLQIEFENQSGTALRFKAVVPTSHLSQVEKYFEVHDFDLNPILGYEKSKEILFCPNARKLLLAKSEFLTTHGKTRVLIVDDSPTIRKLLTQIITAQDDLEVVGECEDPTQIGEMIKNLGGHRKPHVITLDIQMPKMTGTEWIKRNLHHYPIPVVMITSTSIEDGPQVLEALDNGAVDYIQKPSFEKLSEMAPRICEKIKNAKNARVLIRNHNIHSKRLKSLGCEGHENGLIVVGSSTGGTEALRELLSVLPAEIPPIVIVQHIPAVFSKAFAERLGSLTPFKVKEAQEGDVVVPNQVLIAPGGMQLKLVKRGKGIVVSLKDAPPVNRHKPSVDYLFESVVPIAESKSILAIMLTGMGGDGAAQMLELHKRGAFTIAQNEESCIVFGMPKEAIRLGAVDRVMHLKDMGAQVVKWAGSLRSKSVKKAS